LQANFYRGIFKDVIASGKLYGGYIEGWGGDNILVNDRFYKGSYDFRGYEPTGIGARVIQTDTLTGEVRRGQSLGGNAYALAATEVSFPLFVPQLSGSLFAEAGTVGLIDDEFQFDVTDGNIRTQTIDELSVRAMIGASVYWESPFGPIRFDFTQPLRKFPYDERKSFQFTTRTRF